MKQVFIKNKRKNLFGDVICVILTAVFVKSGTTIEETEDGVLITQDDTDSECIVVEDCFYYDPDSNFEKHNNTYILKNGEHKELNFEDFGYNLITSYNGNGNPYDYNEETRKIMKMFWTNDDEEEDEE